MTILDDDAFTAPYWRSFNRDAPRPTSHARVFPALPPFLLFTYKMVREDFSFLTESLSFMAGTCISQMGVAQASPFLQQTRKEVPARMHVRSIVRVVGLSGLGVEPAVFGDRTGQEPRE